MRWLDKPLQNDVATNGIISFEFAKDLESSISIIDSWDDESKLYAGISLGFDYLFMYSYSILMFYLLRSISKRVVKKTMRILGSILSLLVILAGVFDALENYALIKLFLGDLDQQYSSMAFWFASIKFFIITVAIVYIVVFGVKSKLRLSDK